MIGRDVDAARARRLDRAAGIGHQDAPARLVRDLQVEDLDGHARALADRDRFFDRRITSLPSPRMWLA